MPVPMPEKIGEPPASPAPLVVAAPAGDAVEDEEPAVAASKEKRQDAEGSDASTPMCGAGSSPSGAVR